MDHLLHMVSGLGGQHVPAHSPFEWCFGHVPGSPTAKLTGEPGTVFNIPGLDLVFVRLGESDKLPAGSEPFDAGLLKRVLAAVADNPR